MRAQNATPLAQLDVKLVIGIFCSKEKSLERQKQELMSQTNFRDGSPDLVVMGGDSCPEGCGFESWYHILDELFHINLL